VLRELAKKGPLHIECGHVFIGKFLGWNFQVMSRDRLIMSRESWPTHRESSAS
jgi:hypothetical protein